MQLLLMSKNQVFHIKMEYPSNNNNNSKNLTIASTKFVDYPVVDKTPARTEVL